MPLLRYFAVAGGALLLVLLVAGAWLPQAPGEDGIVSSAEHPAIRIRSERKAPEAVVFDTGQQTVPLAKTEATAPVPVKVTEPQPPAAETLAQSAEPKPVATPPAKKPESGVRVKRRMARAHIRRPLTLVAQRPYYWSFDTHW